MKQINNAMVKARNLKTSLVYSLKSFRGSLIR